MSLSIPSQYPRNTLSIPSHEISRSTLWNECCSTRLKRKNYAITICNILDNIKVFGMDLLEYLNLLAVRKKINAVSNIRTVIVFSPAVEFWSKASGNVRAWRQDIAHMCLDSRDSVCDEAQLSRILESGIRTWNARQTAQYYGQRNRF